MAGARARLRSASLDRCSWAPAAPASARPRRLGAAAPRPPPPAPRLLALRRFAGTELIHNAQLPDKTAAAAAQGGEGPVTVRYVDLSKTADVYDKVRQYQETGKKRYP